MDRAADGSAIDRDAVGVKRDRIVVMVVRNVEFMFVDLLPSIEIQYGNCCRLTNSGVIYYLFSLR